ncbi:MAG: hypothetical protein KDC98_03815 [Planctomycetes bacterium]|nr:hypothetical protein [Planctomycetota bacterium]
MTRSDLAQLEVPAGEVLHWLAEGWLDQVGSLPSEERYGNPVFAVTNRELRLALAERLGAIGKTEVVFSALRVRSVLGRAMLMLRALGADVKTEAVTSEPAPAVGARGEVADHGIDSTPLPEVTADSANANIDEVQASEALLDAAGDIEREVEACIEMAREEARLDALEFAAEPTAEAVPADDEDGFFDYADLTTQLDTWTGEEHLAHADEGEGDAVDGATAGENIGLALDHGSMAMPSSEDDMSEPTPEAEIENGDPSRAESDLGMADATEPPATDAEPVLEHEEPAEVVDAAPDEAEELPAEDAPSAEHDEADTDSFSATDDDAGIVDPDVAAALAYVEVEAEGEGTALEGDETEQVATDAETAEVVDAPDEAEELPAEDAPDVNHDEVAADSFSATDDDAGIVDPDVAAALAYVEVEAEGETGVGADSETAGEARTESGDAGDESSDPSTAIADEPGPGSEQADAADPYSADEDLVEAEAAAALAADGPISFETAEAVSEPDVTEPEVTEPEPEVTNATADTRAVAEPEPRPASFDHTTDAVGLATGAAMNKVESFLGELRGALIDLAQRPQAPAVDMQPLVAAVGEFGQRIEHGVAIGVHAAMSNQPVVQPTAFIQPRGNHTNLILFATAFLLLCWGAIFWFKTGNVRLALGTVVGANVVGCLLLAGRR